MFAFSNILKNGFLHVFFLRLWLPSSKKKKKKKEKKSKKKKMKCYLIEAFFKLDLFF